MLKQDYLRDGTAIYERSFAIIRAEADLARFSAGEADIVVRMIHTAGSVDLARDVALSPGFSSAAIACRTRYSKLMVSGPRWVREAAAATAARRLR